MVSLHTHHVMSRKWLIPGEAKAPRLAQKTYCSGGQHPEQEPAPGLGPLTNTLQPERQYDLSKVTLQVTGREILESRCQALSLIYFKKPR